MPLSAPASGSRGLCLPGLALLAARGRKGRGGAVPGCGRELPWLQLERPEKGKEEETEGYPAGSCLSTWRTAERQELQKRKEGPKEKEASYLANAPSSATSESCVQLGRLLQGGRLCLHRLQPRVRVWPLHLVLHRASWEGMSPEPGGLQPQHPDLQLDQVHLRQWQEVDRHRLCDLALSLGGRGRLQPHSGGRGLRHGAGLVLLWEADGCAAGAGPGTRGSRAGRCRPCPGWRQQPQYPPVPPRIVFPGCSRRAGVREGLAEEHNHPTPPPPGK
ncbi:uncharacterized protein O3Q21_008923 [Podargus strigoides]